MYLDFTTKGARLLEPNEFRSFKIVSAAGPNALKAGRTWLHPHEGKSDHYWVDIEHLSMLGPSDADWQKQFRAMLEKVRPHGWISPDGRSVLGHIEAA